MDPLQIFENFKLDTLDEKWSDEVWHREFLSFPEPPVEYSILLGSEDMELFLKETRNAVKKWIDQNTSKDETSDQERPEVSWQTLTALNINIRGLLAVLGYLLKNGQAMGADEDSRQACLASTSLYFTLLSIPGSSSFHVFHPNLYERAIETLRLSEHLLPSKKTQRVIDIDSLYAEDQDEELQKSEIITLTKGLNSILFDLITMLKTFYMKYQLRSLEITVMNLVKVTKLETEINHFETHNNHAKIASKTSLSYNAYVALQDLCDPRHGAIEDTIRLIMKYLMLHLCPNYLDLPNRASNIVWDTIIHFLKNLLDLKGFSAELGIRTLVQHLLVKSPDRSEPRQKQAGVIAKIINICHGEIFHKLLEDLIKFSFHNRIPCRIFGQEVIGKLLSEISVNMQDNGTDYREKTKIVLIATALSRCVDSSSMVRGKAMSTIESILHNENVTIRNFLNISEENSPFPTEKILLDALSTDVNPLPGPNIFNSMLLDRIKDERALVRRSAMHALQDLVTHFPPLLHKIVPVIGHHCRDPALSVRKDAVHALATLLQSNPLDDKLLDEFVKCVLPRIYDVETKVQEKVLESLQNLILNKISSFTMDSDDQEQYLPWKIINQLTIQKMRKNLSKICDSWVKSKVITNSVISKIQTHIGTKHDIEAWVLLSALAENIQIVNTKKYFEDYKKIIEGNDFVTTLKLEVLRHSWQNMGKEYLENLHAYIFDSLCKFHVSIESIGICIDILDEITKRLRGSEAEESIHSQVVELMKLSELQIEKLTDENQQVDDKTIVPYLKAMSILGHASFLCSENVSEITLNIIEGFLLDCDSIHMPDDCLEKFKAAGVVMLGQQAMRDREIAEQIMPILGRLMVRSSSSESSTQAAIRINAVKALADLCVRFTALVEPYLPDMCISMKDPDAQVRETIVVIFVQLLLEDYIKVKGAFFYHILTMLSDTDETIRELTIFLIKERLLTKNKTLISQSFIRSIFHYNNCETRHKFNDRKIRKKEKDALTLPGQKNQENRRMIYDFMLEHLDPPSKLKILTKLNSEVLEGVSEKFINVKQAEGADVLKDVLYIISNDRMQATFGHKTQQDEEFQDEGTAAIENPANNALNVITDGMKKFKLRVMIPTLIRLRQFLTACKSPLLIDVSKFFSKIISEFNKDQIAEIYDEHPELKKEIDRDISVYGKRRDADDSDFEEEHESVSNSVSEDSESCALKKTDFNANIAKTNKSDQQNSYTSTTTTTTITAATPRKIQDIQFNGKPRVVLRRLSTLTYPGIQQWMSPPRDSNKSQCSDPGPSSSGISSNSPSEDLNPSSSDFSEPEISSTPKPKKKVRLSRQNDSVQMS